MTKLREKAKSRNDFDFLKAIHESEADHAKTPPQPEHHFEVFLEPDIFTEEKYQLFAQYQRHVHKESPDEISRSGFRRFLCSSPLRNMNRILGDTKKTQFLGSFHHCYRLDGKLVAIGVLDLLPHAVSAVYFIYHQDLEKFSLGKLSALREAALTLEGEHQYYYMGYYIHSCQKMRYKAEFKPQYILDLETMQWNLLDDPQIRRSLDETEGKPDPVTVRYPSPKEAYSSGESVLTLGLVGAMKVEEIMSCVALREILIQIQARGRSVVAPLKASASKILSFDKRPCKTSKDY